MMVSRDRARGEAALSELSAHAVGAPPELMLADLSSQADIRRLAAQVHARYDRLDVLVNNAGNTFMTRQVSVDGVEMSLAVNHLAAFLLTALLLPLLHAAPAARIVTVGTRLETAMQLDDLQWEKRPYNGLAAYAQSKLGNLHFTFALAERLAGKAISAHCVHPGVFRSNLGRRSGPSPLWIRLITALSAPFLTRPETAARRVSYIATAPELNGKPGGYWGDRVPLPAPPQTRDPNIREQVWRISQDLTGRPFAE
jgi:NAD(P)-dependent dehydrogenase (short-subunit alcohol dehydrogenase family)